MKKQRRKIKLFPVILLIVFLAISIVCVYRFVFSSNKETKSNKNGKDNIVKPQKIDNQHYEATFIGVGDNLIHSSVYRYANKLANYSGYDFKPIISNIKNIVSDYDIAYYNQETILGGTELGLSDYPVFNSPYEAGEDMIDAGFNLVSLATNHTMDRGAAAVLNSCEFWKKHSDVLSAGSYCSEDERNEIKIKEVKNITYTMLNYSYGTNGMPTYEDYYINVWPTNTQINNPEIDTQYQNYKKQVKEDIERVRDEVDLLMVAMHWGVEYTHEPTEYEVDMANYLASLGVDVIIGTHPHVIQPVTWIDDTLVIYSLGNFLSAQYQNQYTCLNYKCTIGLMTNFTIEKDIIDGDTSVKITNVENELIYNYYNQAAWSGFYVIPFSNPEIEEYLPNYKSLYETYKNVVQKYDSSIVVKDAA